jgi:putative colanic acid biosynthesis UDP-glucose lipid carrier transferase
MNTHNNIGMSMLNLMTVAKPLLRRHSSISNTLQATMDGAAIILITLGLIHWNIGYISLEYTLLILMLMGTLAVVYDKLAVYRTNTSFTHKVIILAKGWSLTFMILVLMAFLTKSANSYSRILLTELFVLGFVAQASLHLLVLTMQKKIVGNSHNANRVIIIGEGRLANYLNHKITNNPWLGQKVIGRVSLDSVSAAEDASILEDNSPPSLGSIDNLIELIEQHQITTIYIVTPLETSQLLEPLYFSLLDKHVTVHWVPDIFSMRLINHSVKEIAGVPVLTLSETPLVGMPLALKNIEDISLATIILILLSPLFALIAVLIKLDSSGPVFFKQKRTGWNGKVFEIWKFRSMYVHNLESGQLKQAQKNDPRITKIGRFIRRTSIDELPQLFNVILGSMSLVGPRPHATQHDTEYSRKITHYFARHNIKPGITGLAQVRGLRGETKEINQMILRVESDIEYINNWSLGLDFLILLRTFAAFTNKNAR